MDFVLNYRHDVMGDRVLFADVTNVRIQPPHGPGRRIVKHGEPKAFEGGLCRGGGSKQAANTRSAEPEP